ncbi:kelch-like protein 22 isoform X2 [Lineus longissimus]|uniref:kelch-like protein 22 isoform X2 n=1 Tax=Lineus longissimus TaxID=88925 RepID=UPI00315DF532
MAENIESTLGVMELEKTDHNSQVMEHLLSFYQDKSLCDITLKAGNYSVQAHRVVLAANSDYFSAMFSRIWSEGLQDSSITLHELTPCGLKAVVEFCYHGKLTVDSENTVDILSAIHHCQVVKAYKLFEDYLSKNIEKYDVRDLFTLSELYDLKNLHQDIVTFAACHVMPLFCDVENESTNVDVVNLISAATHNFFREVLITWKDLALGFGQVAFYDAIVKWIQFDSDERGKRLAELVAAASPDEFDAAEVMRYCQLTAADRRLEAEHGGLSFITAVKNFSGNACDKLVAYKGPEGIPREISSLPISGVESWEYCLCQLDTELYFIYGNTPVTKYAPKAAAGSYKYNSCLDRWFPIRSLPSSRRRFSTVASNGKLLVLGGLDHNNCTLDTVEVYDTTNNTWSECVPLAIPLYGHATAAYQGRIYVSGGCTQMHGKCSNKLFCFEPELRLWIEGNTVISARRGHGLVAHNGCLYQFGGSNDLYEIPDPKLEYYDMSTQHSRWIRLDLFGMTKNPCGILSTGDSVYFCIVDWAHKDSFIIYRYQDQTRQLFEVYKTSAGPSADHSHIKNFSSFMIPAFVYSTMPKITFD